MIGKKHHLHPGKRERDRLGANFIVKWVAREEVNAPIIECVMAGNQRRAFVPSGRVIKEVAK
ncbi:MAG: DUF3124 domain-containing protein [Deltaproteobacteria bacterium]|nr:DUF3124 domain-containing protein [Deltaproteobacteria bacterium]